MRFSVSRVCAGTILAGALLVFIVHAARSAERADIVVARDGSGQFRSIQAAIDSVPESAARTWIILVKRGTYGEKLFISKNNIALVGEHRDSTRIVYAELRSIWRQTHTNDWGAAVVNIGNSVEDLTLANLTVHNNYGSLYGSNDHQFALRGGGACTRIILLSCSILSDGGDALSLWNTASGMYYHADCFFSGYVDYVCPRGSCYITDSRFYGYNLSASIWHDGSLDSSSKFVIRSSSFDGVKGFPLGRNHRDAQFYLLDCTFSGNMADRPIYQAALPSAYKWGRRYFYWNCRRQGGNYAWFADNLDSAYGGAVREDEVTASWTFRGRWDPERTMPRVLPVASIPWPRMNATGVTLTGRDSLRWIGARNAVSYNLYMGTTSDPPIIRNQEQAVYAPGVLREHQDYYWRVDAVTGEDTLKGPLWHFTTAASAGLEGKAR